MLAVIERDVARTRMGTNGVAQVETRGVIAAAFDHWDSRENDPNLHTHVVIANRVQGPDGRWRTLDSRAMHRAAVAMSERYDNALADRITERLGLGWEYRERGPRRNPAYELSVVPQPLVQEFSRRADAIDAETDRLVEAYVQAHGHRPPTATILQLRQQATLATRQPKIVRSLSDLTDEWRQRADRLLGPTDSPWMAQVGREAAVPAAVTDPLTPDLRASELAGQVLTALTAKRSTWTPWNVDAEASRLLRAHRFDTPADRDRALAEIVDAVAARAVLLTPPEQASTPEPLRRSDGSSAFRHHRAERYTSQVILDAERRLLAAGRDRTGPVTTTALEALQADGLHDDQAMAVRSIASSGRVVDVLVGPAGSGKTRALASLRTAWEREHGPGSVIGLAPSAAAADVLAASLGMPTENTAKWLVEHDAERDRLRRIDQIRAALNAAPEPATAATLTRHLERLVGEVERWRFHPGQLVIVDEASLAGTLALDRIAACAGEAGAKLVCVGDWAQLSSIEAGGAFGLLVRERGQDVPELGAARRFVQEWERHASTRIRVGDASAVDAYAAHGRIHDGDLDAVLESAYQAWSADEASGKRSLLLAADVETVRSLNARARAERVIHGLVEPEGTTLRDGLKAGVGDRVVSRLNDRRLAVGTGWVKNGDTWVVTQRHQDGALRVQRPAGGPSVTLPAAYVAQHVELAYATTAYRAQGATVDTAHAIVAGPGLTREVLYVMLTRAREANHVYVSTERAVEPLQGFSDEPVTATSVLRDALARLGDTASAHETQDAEREAAASIRTLAAEYETLAHLAQAPRWLDLLSVSGLLPDDVQRVADSPAFGAFTSALRRAEAHGLPVERALPALSRDVTDGAVDPAAVLHRRVERWVQTSLEAGHGRRPDLVCGLLPAAKGVDDPQFARALDERMRLMERRADELLDRAETADAPWLRSLRPHRDETASTQRWSAEARTVAAYRERNGISRPRSCTRPPTPRGHPAADRVRPRRPSSGGCAAATAPDPWPVRQRRPSN